MLPVRRDLHFHLPADRVCDWNGHGRMVSHFFNALSIFFPEGERFFIQSVRHYRDRVRDPELQQAVAAFIGQEAMHGREHTEYNALLEQAGLPAAACERRVVRLLTRVKRIQPPAMQLAATIALEHFTAIMADRLLRDFDASMHGAEPHYARVWRWHALEETEHKAVAFDVFRAIFGNGLRAWALRAFGLLVATLIFWPMVSSSICA
jgi:Predicted metal-dependent hydrolase